MKLKNFLFLLSVLFLLNGCTTDATRQGFECLKIKGNDFCDKHNQTFLGIHVPIDLGHRYEDFVKFVCLDNELRTQEDYLFSPTEIEVCRPK